MRSRKNSRKGCAMDAKKWRNWIMVIKKAFCILLSFMLMLSITACGGDDEPKETEKMTTANQAPA